MCLRCGGLWFEAGELARAIRSHDADAVSGSFVAESVGEVIGASRDVCPACKTTLAIHRLSQTNPALVEICQTCSGAWLPHGEIERAQAGHELRDARAAIDAERSWGVWFFQFLVGLPVEFNVQPRRVPAVTIALIAVNGILYNGLFLLFLFGPGALLQLVLYPSHLGQLQWFTSLLTSQFLHGGLIHLVGNMYFLWILGDNVEDVLGRGKFLVFYLAAGVAAGVVYTTLEWPSDSPTIGASGAISGVMGIYAILFRRSKLTFMLVFWQFKLAAPLYVGIWAMFNLGGWLVDAPGVAWEAHLGGLGFGLLTGLVAYPRLLRRRPLLRLLNRKVELGTASHS